MTARAWLRRGAGPALAALLVALEIARGAEAPDADRALAFRCAVHVVERACAGAEVEIDRSLLGPCRDRWRAPLDVERTESSVIVRGPGGVYVSEPLAARCASTGRRAAKHTTSAIPGRTRSAER